MDNWQKVLVAPDMPIVEVIRLIDIEGTQFAIVVGADGELVGAVTDGDVRRGILRGVPLDARVEEIMHRQPFTVRETEGVEAAFDVMRAEHLRQIPIVDERNRVTRVVSIDDFFQPQAVSAPVVIMAGGRGRRMKSLTRETPKPMLPVAERPVLDHILHALSEQGFKNVFLAVNYLADIIEAHVGDGAELGMQLRYLREEEPMGTCGALKLLPSRPEESFLVLNGDLITQIDYRHLLAFHAQTGAIATVCVREYMSEIPFGVVGIEGERMTRIEEKPTHRCMVNAGMYALEPAALDLLPKDGPMDMTDLLQLVLDKSLPCAAFPVHEYWRDIGRPADLLTATEELGSGDSSG